MSDALAAWLLAQRWFRSKQRPIASVTEHDRAPLGDAALVILEVAYADGGPPDHYLVPDVEGREPRDGEGAWTAIVRGMADGAQLRGLRGSFSCSRTAALDELLPSASLSAAALRERRLGVEQSNTSVVLDDRLILKLYRLLEPGLNPDLEVSLFLADAGFADTPATAGAMTWSPDGAEPSAAAMLQAFVPSTGDAWAAMLGRLADDPAHAVDIVARIGEVTARMHAALASRPADPAFPSRVATVAETAAWRASAERQLALAVSAVGWRRARADGRARAGGDRALRRHVRIGDRRGAGHPHPRRLPPRPAPCPDRWRVQRHRLRGRAGAAAPRATRSVLASARRRRDAAQPRLRRPHRRTEVSRPSTPRPGWPRRARPSSAPTAASARPRSACWRPSSWRRPATRSATRRATAPTGCGCRSRQWSGLCDRIGLR